MNIKQIIESRAKFGIKLGLDNIKDVMFELGNPQDSVDIIHIAGTNGKGSTLGIIEQVLCDSNYDVCKYTSPYLISEFEMWQYNMKDIEQSLIRDALISILEAEERTAIELTRYELTTAIMFVVATKLKCDYLLLETGLGGRLDATNIVNPKYNLITNVSLDHVQILGPTLFDIAKEKVAILKKDAYIGSINENLRKALSLANIKYQVTNDVVYQSELDFDNFQTIVSIEGLTYNLSLYGLHQVDNFLLAYKLLRDIGISRTTIQNSVSKVYWPARLELISNNPQIIYDGAHNLDAAKVLTESLDGKYDVYYSSFADKDVTEVVEQLLTISNKFIFVEMEEERALCKEQFSSMFPNLKFDVIKACELKNALSVTKSKSIVCGSLNLYKNIK